MNYSQRGQPVLQYKKPVPTVDIIIIVPGGVVLINRKNKPLGWALPGGFVDYGETLERAAVREAMEETGLQIILTGQMHTYSSPNRDPRQHTISTVFTATANMEPQAGDDAVQVAIFPLDKLPPLVFDHATILSDFCSINRE